HSGRGSRARSKTARLATIAIGRHRYIPKIRQTAQITWRRCYRLCTWLALDPLVPRDIDYEDGRSAEGHFHGIGHVELARFHDRGHRVDELAPRVAGLADRRDDVVDLRLLDPGKDRGMRLRQETALRVQPRDPEILVGQRVDKGARVLRMDDRHHQLHRAATIPRASGRAI